MSTDNDCIPFWEPGAQTTAVAAGAILGKRFVHLTGAPTSGGRPVVAQSVADPGVPCGVAAFDAADTTDLMVYWSDVVVPVVCGAVALNAGDPVRSDINGKAVVAASGELAAGTVWDDVAPAADAPIKLQPYLVP